MTMMSDGTFADRLGACQTLADVVALGAQPDVEHEAARIARIAREVAAWATEARESLQALAARFDALERPTDAEMMLTSKPAREAYFAGRSVCPAMTIAWRAPSSRKLDYGPCA
jgi:hypothetical protein